MKKAWIVLSMVVFCLTGCKGNAVVEEANPIVSEEKEDKTEDEALNAEAELDVPAEENPKQSEDKLETAKENIPVEEPKPEQPRKESETVIEETPNTVAKEETVTEPQNTFVAYSPQTVVALATTKTKGYGKITLTENLDKLLSEGVISKEEYDEYYPYDGAGYYSVFVETNLREAKTTSGRLLETEDGIAQYIADMLALESGPYFLIEYVGVYSTGNTDFYEFRCYRA